jgi:hypothetical protein
LIHGLPQLLEPYASPRPARRIRSVVIHPWSEASPPRVDAYGFTKVRDKHSSRRHCQHWAQHTRQPPTASPHIPTIFCGKCFNCLSTKHLVDVQEADIVLPPPSSKPQASAKPGHLCFFARRSATPLCLSQREFSAYTHRAGRRGLHPLTSAGALMPA